MESDDILIDFFWHFKKAKEKLELLTESKEAKTINIEQNRISTLNQSDGQILLSEILTSALEKFKRALSRKEKGAMSAAELMKLGALKKKDYTWDLYLAAITSLPILYRVAERGMLEKAILAKTASIVGLRALDKINDQFHTTEEAVNSLQRYQTAVIGENLELNPECSRLGIAENAILKLSRWSFEWMRGLQGSRSWNQYVHDIRDLIGSKIQPLEQPFNSQRPSLNFESYLNTMTKVNIWRVWMDIDFCFYEDVVGEPHQYMDKLKRGTDYLNKSILLYYDVVELQEDMRFKTVNSVMLYALENGALKIEDMTSKRPREIYRVLMNSGAVAWNLKMGRHMFQEALNSFKKVADEYTDVDGLIHNTQIIRIMLLRNFLHNSMRLSDLILFGNMVN